VKKIIQISFAVIYFFLTTGFTVTLHFCGGEVSDVSIVRTHGDEDPCGCEPTSCMDSCCLDDVTTIKLSDSHKSEAKFEPNSFQFVIALIPSEDLSGYKTVTDISSDQIVCDSGPPDLFLQNCSFLI